MLTEKHYQTVANRHRAGERTQEIIEKYAANFTKDNPGFDRKKFYEASDYYRRLARDEQQNMSE